MPFMKHNYLQTVECKQYCGDLKHLEISVIIIILISVLFNVYLNYKYP